MLLHIRITNDKVINVILRAICCSAIYTYTLRNFQKALKTIKRFSFTSHTTRKQCFAPTR